MYNILTIEDCVELHETLLQAEEDRKVEALRTSKTSNDPADTSVLDGSEKVEEAVPHSFSDDPGSNNSGYYELQVDLCIINLSRNILSHFFTKVNFPRHEFNFGAA